MRKCFFPSFIDGSVYLTFNCAHAHCINWWRKWFKCLRSKKPCNVECSMEHFQNPFDLYFTLIWQRANSAWMFKCGKKKSIFNGSIFQGANLMLIWTGCFSAKKCIHFFFFLTHNIKSPNNGCCSNDTNLLSIFKIDSCTLWFKIGELIGRKFRLKIGPMRQLFQDLKPKHRVNHLFHEVL